MTGCIRANQNSVRQRELAQPKAVAAAGSKSGSSVTAFRQTRCEVRWVGEGLWWQRAMLGAKCGCARCARDDPRFSRHSASWITFFGHTRIGVSRDLHHRLVRLAGAQLQQPRMIPQPRFPPLHPIKHMRCPRQHFPRPARIMFSGGFTFQGQ